MFNHKTRGNRISAPSRPALFFFLCCLPLAAPAANGVNWDFRGFGSLAGTKTDADNAEYRLDLRQAKGADEDIDWGLHSNLGGQLTADFNSQFSLTGQAVAKRRGDDDMEPDVEWFYADYRPVDWLDIHVGRMAMPELMVSDYRSVYYAQPTIGPPAAAYQFGSITSFDGLQLLGRFSIGSSYLSVQASAGSADEEFYFLDFTGRVVPQEAELDELVGLNVSWEWNDLTLRAAHVEAGDVTQQIPEEFQVDGVEQMDVEIKFKGFGAQYDNGSLLAMAEHVDREGLGKVDYLLLGWRLGKWQPSVTVSETELVSAFGPPTETDGKAVTLRYDMTSNTALKLQWEEAAPADFFRWLSTDDTFYGTLDPATFTFTPDYEHRDIVSVSLDFLF